MPPSYKEPYELLAKDAKRLVFLVLALLIIFIIKLPDEKILALLASFVLLASFWRLPTG